MTAGQQRSRPRVALAQCAPLLDLGSGSEGAALAALSEGVLGEIRHELGNLFHKLYYWLEQVEAPGEGTGASPCRMLADTARQLEAFLVTTLEYFHPVALAPVPMPAREVVTGLRVRVAGLSGGQGDDGSDAGPRGTVLVDLEQLPGVLEAAAERLAAEAEASDSVVRLEVREVDSEHGRGLALELSLGSRSVAPPAAELNFARTLRWARAQRVAALHGGSLAERTAPDGMRVVALFLPYIA